MASNASDHPIVWLEHARQTLGLVPSLGGSVAAWRWLRPEGTVDVWRAWDGVSTDLVRLASFPMVPWSNRIGAGGFAQDGRFHAIKPNRIGEPYPIHGDGWLQPWQLRQTAPDAVEMRLESHRFDGNPYDYAALQTFRLVDGGLDQTLQVTHLGAAPLPYGLGVHPWFERTPQARVTAQVKGMWLSGDDPMPTGHTTRIPPDCDLSQGVNVNGPLIDNGYSGWSGSASIEWPERGLRLSVSMPHYEADGGAAKHWCLLYRPPVGSAFCFEPITQPIDAFHLPQRPGLRVLSRDERMTLAVQWRFGGLDPG